MPVYAGVAADVGTGGQTGFAGNLEAGTNRELRVKYVREGPTTTNTTDARRNCLNRCSGETLGMVSRARAPISNGSSADATSFTTASSGGSADVISGDSVDVVAFVASAGSAFGADPTVSSNDGGTWTQLAAIDIDTTNHVKLWVYIGLNVGSVSRTVTFNFGALTINSITWHLVNLENVIDVTAVQVKTASIGVAGTSVSGTLDSTPSPYETLLLSFVGKNTTSAVTPRSNWTELSDTTQTTQNISLESQTKHTALETTFSGTWTGNALAAAVCVELRGRFEVNSTVGNPTDAIRFDPAMSQNWSTVGKETVFHRVGIKGQGVLTWHAPRPWAEFVVANGEQATLDHNLGTSTTMGAASFGVSDELPQAYRTGGRRPRRGNLWMYHNTGNLRRVRTGAGPTSQELHERWCAYTLFPRGNDRWRFELLPTLVNQVSHSVELDIVKSQTKTHAVEVDVQKSQTKTHAVEADLSKTQTKTHAVEVDLSSSGNTVAHAVEVDLLKTRTKTHAVEVDVSTTFTLVHDVEVLLSSPGGATTVAHDVEVLAQGALLLYHRVACLVYVPSVSHAVTCAIDNEGGTPTATLYGEAIVALGNWPTLGADSAQWLMSIMPANRTHDVITIGTTARDFLYEHPGDAGGLVVAWWDQNTRAATSEYLAPTPTSYYQEHAAAWDVDLPASDDDRLWTPWGAGGRWMRVEWEYVAHPLEGSVTARMFHVGESSPVAEVSLTGIDTGVGIREVRFGPLYYFISLAEAPVFMDSMALSEEGWIGDPSSYDVSRFIKLNTADAPPGAPIAEKLEVDPHATFNTYGVEGDAWDYVRDGVTELELIGAAGDLDQRVYWDDPRFYDPDAAAPVTGDYCWSFWPGTSAGDAWVSWIPAMYSEGWGVQADLGGLDGNRP